MSQSDGINAGLLKFIQKYLLSLLKIPSNLLGPGYIYIYIYIKHTHTQTNKNRKQSVPSQILHSSQGVEKSNNTNKMHWMLDCHKY